MTCFDALMPDPTDPPTLPPGAVPLRPVIDEERDRTLLGAHPSTCSTCEYFNPISEPGKPLGGQCRIGPPDTHVVLLPPAELTSAERQFLDGRGPGPQIMPVAIWPGVDGDAWCGAHSER